MLHELLLHWVVCVAGQALLNSPRSLHLDGPSWPLYHSQKFEVTCLLHEQPHKGWHLTLVSLTWPTPASQLARLKEPARPWCSYA